MNDYISRWTICNNIKKILYIFNYQSIINYFCNFILIS